MESWTFIAQNAPNFKWRARGGLIQFTNGQFTTTNAALADELRNTIDPASPIYKHAVAMYVRYADKELAARVAKRHKLAVSGTLTSGELTSARLQAETDQRDVELRAMLSDPAAAAAFQQDIARDVLAVTQPAAAPATSFAALLKTPVGEQ